MSKEEIIKIHQDAEYKYQEDRITIEESYAIVWNRAIEEAASMIAHGFKRHDILSKLRIK